MRQSLGEAVWRSFWVWFWTPILRWVVLLLVLQLIKCVPT